jgi:hypothetical protein
VGKNTLTRNGTLVDRAWKEADRLEAEARELRETGDVDCLRLAEDYERQADELRRAWNNDR